MSFSEATFKNLHSAIPRTFQDFLVEVFREKSVIK